MTVEETLRLYPPVWAFSRRAEADDLVDGYRVPKGARILISPYVFAELCTMGGHQASTGDAVHRLAPTGQYFGDMTSNGRD